MLQLCPLASGSSGNSIFIGNDHTHILVDAGVSGKKIEEGLRTLDRTSSDISAILITHEHIDHVAGLGVLARKLRKARPYDLRIYGTEKTIRAIRAMSNLGEINDALYCPIKAGETFTHEDLTITSIPISHDAADPVAYRVESEGQKVAVMTDLGTYDDHIVAGLQNLDALVLEANHDVRMLELGPYPYPLKQRILGNKGHLSNERSGQLLCEILHDDLKGIFLGHLSKENNHPDVAYEAVRMEITMGDNPYKAEDFPIYVASRDKASPCITV